MAVQILKASEDYLETMLMMQTKHGYVRSVDVAEQSRQGEIMEKLAVTLHLNERGKGIAFSIPFSGLASQLDSYALLAGMKASANLIDLN